jgi:hypothetical protein
MNTVGITTAILKLSNYSFNWGQRNKGLTDNKGAKRGLTNCLGKQAASVQQFVLLYLCLDLD